MLATDIIINEFAESVITGIRNAMPFVSGDTERSLFYRYDGRRLQIGSTFGWITVLEDGRRPGKRMPKAVIEGQMADWVRHEIPSAENPKSLAYAIATIQAEKGSLLYRQGGNSGVLSDYTNLEYVHEHLTIPIKDEIIATIVGLLKAA